MLVALNVYHKLRFGQLHARQPVIVQVAEKLGRSANSVAMKLSNFASLDPSLKLRGIKGLTGASTLDRTVWDEFQADLSESVPASEEVIRNIFGAQEDEVLEVVPQEGLRKGIFRPPSETMRVASVKLRRGQEYFRDVVLNNFGGRCGVTTLAVRELLVSSHILPWSDYPEQRLNLRNGLCLSRLHDAAFDTGLIAFDDALRLMLSPRLQKELSNRSVEENFGHFSGLPLSLPDDAIPPEPAFLAKHRATIFQSAA